MDGIELYNSNSKQSLIGDGIKLNPIVSSNVTSKSNFNESESKVKETKTNTNPYENTG